jgi:hypothetical protein
LFSSSGAGGGGSTTTNGGAGGNKPGVAAHDLDKADAALKKGLALLDFRDARYTEFFRRRVRLHERFGLLEDLRQQLIKASAVRPPGEQALRDRARFEEMTADSVADHLHNFDSYWRLQQAILEDKCRQLDSLPTLFITIAPAEWKFLSD